MKNKFKIKATCKDDNICVESYDTVSGLLTGLRCITKSLITNGDIPAYLIRATVKSAIEEAEHEPTEHD